MATSAIRCCLGSIASVALSVLVLMSPLHSTAGPVLIDYEVGALATLGNYEYRYTVTNTSLTTPVSWFSIDFDPALYDESSLAITTAGLGNWSEQILGSVLTVPAQYDSYKTIGAGLGIGVSETGFTVQFRWLGAGTPGSQAFTVYDPANLEVLSTGVTSTTGVPPEPPNGVPEPSSAALAFLALFGAIAAGRRARPSSETAPVA